MIKDALFIPNDKSERINTCRYLKFVVLPVIVKNVYEYIIEYLHEKYSM